MSYTIKEIKLLLDRGDFNADEIKRLRDDKRKGVQQLLAQYDQKIQRKEELKQQFNEMKNYENAAKASGKTIIAGIDEAGRGPLAGPVVAAAAVLPDHFYLEGLMDSKLLSQQKREEFYEYIINEAEVGVGVVSNEDIDRVNIYQAAKLAMQKAVDQLSTKPDHLLIDAMILDVSCSQQSIVKGDQKSVSIAAASIVAKVTRDRMMREIGDEYPHYGFSSNQGYGTKHHLDALEKYGPTPHHRKSFSPVKVRILL
nr:ribonuclease HII [Halobacillus sp. Marseille-Q1614]